MQISLILQDLVIGTASMGEALLSCDLCHLPACSPLFQDGVDPPRTTRNDFNTAPRMSSSQRASYHETEGAAAAAAQGVSRGQQEEEERRLRRDEEQRLRVTEMLYDLKQDADSQGEELRRHLSKAKEDSEGM